MLDGAGHCSWCWLPSTVCHLDKEASHGHTATLPHRQSFRKVRDGKRQEVETIQEKKRFYP